MALKIKITNRPLAQLTDKTHFNELGYRIKDNSGIVFNPDECSLAITDKKQYFTNGYNKFKRQLSEMQATTLQEFADGDRHYFIDLCIYTLDLIYNGKLDIYVEVEEDNVITLNNWIRRAENGMKVYIVGVEEYTPCDT